MALTKINLGNMVTGTLPDANIPNDITIDVSSAVPASGLTGSTLASGVTASSLTSVGTLTSLATSGVVGVTVANVSGVTASTDADDLVIENTVHNGISILTNDNQTSNIYFGQASSNRTARVDYAGDTNIMHVGTTKASGQLQLQSANGTTGITLDASSNTTFAGKVICNKHMAVGAETAISNWEDTSNEWAALHLGNGGSVFGAGSDTTNSQVYLATNTYYDGGWKRIGAGEASFINLNDDGHIFFQHASTSAGTNSAGGAITFSQSLKLDVDGTATFAGNVGINGGDPSATDQLEIASGGSSTDVRVRFLEDGVSDSYILLDASEDWIGFSSDGTSRDMGINTGSGDATFAGDISMTGSQKKMVLANSSNTSSSMLRISNRSSVTPSWADEYICEIHGSGSGTDSEVLMYLKQHENDADRPILRGVNSSNHVIELGSNEQYKFRGKMSIGDAIHNPGETFHIKNTSDSVGMVLETTSTSHIAIFDIKSAHDSYGTGLAKCIRFWEGATVRNTIGVPSSGNDGNQLCFYIGNADTSADAKLHDNGDWYTNDGTVSSLSDRRGKKDIEDLTDGLDIVKQLKPVTYKHNGLTWGKDDGVTRYGFVADDILPIASHYVHSQDGKVGDEDVDDLKSLSILRMFPMLVKAVQELSDKLDTANTKITALENA